LGASCWFAYHIVAFLASRNATGINGASTLKSDRAILGFSDSSQQGHWYKAWPLSTYGSSPTTDSSFKVSFRGESRLQHDGIPFVLRHRFARHDRSNFQVFLIPCVLFPSGENSKCTLVLQFQSYLDFLDEMDEAGEQSHL
jgi:hypothetical protein